jgi:hypothetical protein
MIWLIQEWPHSRALGERWVAFPLGVPADQKWPGLKFYASRELARLESNQQPPG